MKTNTLPKPLILWKPLAAPIARILTVSAIALALSVFAMESQAGDAGAYGGAGGSPFRITCKPGHVVVGLNTITEHVITAISPICGDRRNDQYATYRAETVGTGSGAGTLREPRCPPGAMMTSLHVFIDSTPLVSRVGFSCYNVGTQELTNSLPNYGGKSSADLRLICSGGEVATGIYGRAGTAIDQLGLLCEYWHVVLPETKVPETKPETKPPPLPEEEEEAFSKPMIGGYRVHYCWAKGIGCGKKAARAFCQSQGYSHVSDYLQSKPLSQLKPTRHIGSGKRCKDALCAAFAGITCVD